MRTPVGNNVKEVSFELTWDYLCPFARNVHEHVALALQAGAPWDVRFRYFSLAQSHLSDVGEPVWADPARHPGVLAGLAGLVVREKYPDKFLDGHLALFSARHDKGFDLRDRAVLVGVLDGAGLDGAAVVEEASDGWPAEQARAEHEEAVERWDVFGVPTFIMADRAVFVRIMRRPGDDPGQAVRAVEKVLELMSGFDELNEYKFTRVPR
jgi:hypothetical protein